MATQVPWLHNKKQRKKSKEQNDAKGLGLRDTDEKQFHHNEKISSVKQGEPTPRRAGCLYFFTVP